jgi:hypothetical protein
LPVLFVVIQSTQRFSTLRHQRGSYHVQRNAGTADQAAPD